ncbi:hypothetical protein [Arthrobacter sp. NIO-1057]|uniref:hypothetical protein n=1 Tax=Arthrobacter sp. NIO-1057 TaxID=993071 RepID=UPI00071CB146|nr:hypothetical protein [Arthrobacter sp. NIO-1057]KSU67674.1 hypothetical protein AS038_00780 [Arthrobacter sp. NIO-1057]SCB75547.1 hypothetical protein GA0061084_0160 [Arthrobacter sp. NIO-1057]
MTLAKNLLNKISGVASSSTAQAIQSLTSLIVLMLAAKLLGLEALGLISTLYGALILAAAIISGFVGDSLTVLDRHDLQVQAGLRFWLALLALSLGVIGAILCWVGTDLGLLGALLYGLVVVAYMAEELVRRSYMVILSFGKLIVVDLVVLGTTSIVLLGFGILSTLTLEAFFLAVLAGQCAGTVFGWLRLPNSEKVPARRPAQIRAVAMFGIWRAALQGLRPAQLTAMRVLVTALIGLAAAGALEAARLYAAPAMLLVNGTCAYLFSSLARDRDVGVWRQLKNTDSVVLKLLLATAGCAAIGLVLLPWGGPLLTGILPSGLAVTGWLAYACAVAASTPYGLLATVHENARPVFVIRFMDSVLSVALIALVLVFTSDYRLVPWAAAAGALTGGLIMRWWLHKSVAAYFPPEGQFGSDSLSDADFAKPRYQQ